MFQPIPLRAFPDNCAFAMNTTPSAFQIADAVSRLSLGEPPSLPLPPSNVSSAHDDHDDVLEEFLGIMRPSRAAVTLVHRRRSSRGPPPSRGSASAASSHPSSPSSTVSFRIQRSHPYRPHGGKRASSSQATTPNDDQSFGRRKLQLELPGSSPYSYSASPVRIAFHTTSSLRCECPLPSIPRSAMPQSVPSRPNYIFADLTFSYIPSLTLYYGPLDIGYRRGGGLQSSDIRPDSVFVRSFVSYMHMMSPLLASPILRTHNPLARRRSCETLPQVLDGSFPFVPALLSSTLTLSSSETASSHSPGSTHARPASSPGRFFTNLPYLSPEHTGDPDPDEDSSMSAEEPVPPDELGSNSQSPVYYTPSQKIQEGSLLLSCALNEVTC
ncbi:hypothetical protein DL93DRAFT_2163571 [Clavulina sp. PMI_390]|nr:hypothetical protein DL93DRAFT_2163571 [Clavulina sp. PMI_390]